jgi:hypothetical protein
VARAVANPGQLSTLTLTLMPEDGFHQPSADLFPIGQSASCTFNTPANFTPSGAPVMSTITMMVPTQLAIAPRQVPRAVPDSSSRWDWRKSAGDRNSPGGSSASRRLRHYRRVVVDFRVPVFRER